MKTGRGCHREVSRRTHRTRWAVSAVLLLAAASFGEDSQGEPRSSVASLELRGRWEVPERKTAPTDVRWADRDSVFLAYGAGAVYRVGLDEGLPVVRQVFAGEGRPSGPMPILSMGLSSSRLFVASLANDLAWIDTRASSTENFELRSLRGYFDDVDLRGDTVALLGYPTARKFTESEQTFLWLGDLRSQLEQWVPLPALREDRGELSSSPGLGSLGMRLGSIRFLAKGDLLVIPGFKPGIYRFSRAGKQRQHWTPDELEASLLGALGKERTNDVERSEPRDLEVREPAWDWVSKVVASQSFFPEDVLAIGDKGAVIARYRSGSRVQYYLGVLESELEWYVLPFEPLSTTSRVRADYSESAKELIVLNTYRFEEDGNEASILCRMTAP